MKTSPTEGRRGSGRGQLLRPDLSRSMPLSARPLGAEVGGRRERGLTRWGPTTKKNWARRVGGSQNFALLFFPFPPLNFAFFFCSLWGLLEDLWSLFKALDLPKCAFGPLWGSFCETLAAFTTIQRDDPLPEREKKTAKKWRSRRGRSGGEGRSRGGAVQGRDGARGPVRMVHFLIG